MPQSLIPDHIVAISFDAVGTLIAPHPSVGAIYSAEMAVFGVELDAELIEKRFRTSFSTAKRDLTIQEIEAREYDYWKSIVRHTIEPSEEPEGFDYDSLFDNLWHLFATAKPWKPIDGAIETFEKLAAKFPIALLTNWDSRARSVFAQFGLLDRFSAIVISSEVGFEKPDRRIFETAAESLEVDPSELLHVGDSLREDIEGATDAGCTAAWLSETADMRLPERSVRISSLRELR